jgi:hypothetical protein
MADYLNYRNSVDVLLQAGGIKGSLTTNDTSLATDYATATASG